MEISKTIKVVLLGDSGVGKTSILLRFIIDDFKSNSVPTLGAAFMIWDTAGQEQYHSLGKLYYQEAEVAILVYDITNKRSFDVLQKWIDELKQHAPADIS